MTQYSGMRCCPFSCINVVVGGVVDVGAVVVDVDINVTCILVVAAGVGVALWCRRYVCCRRYV